MDAEPMGCVVAVHPSRRRDLQPVCGRGAYQSMSHSTGGSPQRDMHIPTSKLPLGSPGTSQNVLSFAPSVVWCGAWRESDPSQIVRWRGEVWWWGRGGGGRDERVPPDPGMCPAGYDGSAGHRSAIKQQLLRRGRESHWFVRPRGASRSVENICSASLRFLGAGCRQLKAYSGHVCARRGQFGIRSSLSPLHCKSPPFSANPLRSLQIPLRTANPLPLSPRQTFPVRPANEKKRAE
ncbi:hypothetical protein BZA05DRAFT_126733 [Tricharina praecox]|uniref:uncharacterized protein n=1 Tax=Tricharina praecox TaxID=43433 RepID=UPI00221F16F7|nr:uncharacterized protein BZA05DRAFT_126733 [Tricharina praecox]KAI5847591.1 hypothetical protein BZA05DRAFT_126733 [Tricharina praecox]